MRGLMVLATMLAAASPAFAQATAVDFGNNDGFDGDSGGSVFGSDFGDDDDDSDFSALNNGGSIDVSQTSFGDQNAAAVDGDAFNPANAFGLSVGQVDGGFDGDFDDDGILDEFDF